MEGYASSKEPDKDYFLNFGKGKIVQNGSSLTIVTWGALVQKSIDASRQSGESVEIIDLRTLYPLDLDLIIESLKKTNRLIVVHEDNLTILGGYGGEIVSLINENAFELLMLLLISCIKRFTCCVFICFRGSNFGSDRMDC